MISFVIPVYKKPQEQFNRAVKSLLDMSEKDIEVIAVFDGADADLESHAAKWAKKDKRFQVKVIDHGGAPRARNCGAEAATGDYVAFWDADCYAEPEMAMMWLRTFKENPDCHFVYSGYKWTDPNIPGFESEPFDPWTLAHYNYIATMFPVKREKLAVWDEDLQGLQDWDYWRRVVENGAKGRFIPGFGFWTETPDKDSISGKTDQRVERIRRIRAKHGDVAPEILVWGQTFKRDAIVLAKTLGADYFPSAFWPTEDYKMILTMGLHPWELMETSGVLQRAKEGTAKAIYWTGHDADNFAMSPYIQTRALMNAINKEIDFNFAMDERTMGVLEDLGIKRAETLIFPREPGEPAQTLPDKFKVLAWADKNHLLYLDGISSAIPDVEFEVVKEDTYYDISKYSVVLQFTSARKLGMGSRNALMMGRHVISNVQEPYSGHVDLSDATKFKNDVIARIREFQNAKQINAKAQAYYLRETDPQRFKERIQSCLAKPALEVVA